MSVKLRYKGTNLGLLWNALEPLLTFLLLYIVFTSIRDRGEEFAIYLLSGIILYHIFIRSTLAGLVSLRGNKNFITTLNIGNGFYPIVAMGGSALTAIVEVGVFLALLPVFQFVPTWTIIFFPLTVVMILFLAWGLTYLLSIMNVYFKDIQPVWSVLVHALFFISPIFWFVSEVDGILLDILKVNPLGQIIELSHNVVLFGQIPPLTDWLYTTAFIVGIFLFGVAMFRKYESKVAEEL